MIVSSSYNTVRVYRKREELKRWTLLLTYFFIQMISSLQKLKIITHTVYTGTCACCSYMLSIPIYCCTHSQPIGPTVLLCCAEPSTYSSHGSGLLSKWLMLGTRYWLQMVRMHRSVPVRVCGVVTPPNLICSPSMRSGI